MPKRCRRCGQQWLFTATTGAPKIMLAAAVRLCGSAMTPTPCSAWWNSAAVAHCNSSYKVVEVHTQRVHAGRSGCVRLLTQLLLSSHACVSCMLLMGHDGDPGNEYALAAWCWGWGVRWIWTLPDVLVLCCVCFMSCGMLGPQVWRFRLVSTAPQVRSQSTGGWDGYSVKAGATAERTRKLAARLKTTHILCAEAYAAHWFT
jgi:hypothetical protein